MILLRRLLGDVLRRQRQRQGRTLREVSSSARVSLGYLSEVERGQKEASSELLSAICDALDVRMSELMREVSDELSLAELAESAAAERAGARTDAADAQFGLRDVRDAVCPGAGDHQGTYARPWTWSRPEAVVGLPRSARRACQPRSAQLPAGASACSAGPNGLCGSWEEELSREVDRSNRRKWMSVVKSPLPDENVKIVGEALQGALVDLVDLSLVAKQVHWNVVGPRFRSVHLQLDEVVATARTHTDSVAERASAIGVPPDGRAETVARTERHRRREGRLDKDVDAVRTLVAALGAVITRMRERIDDDREAGPGDPGPAHRAHRDLEKHHWMFQAENVDAAPR